MSDRACGLGRPRVVHLTGDFPDPIGPDKTDAIRRLIELTAGRFDHRVISINRVTPPFDQVRSWLGRHLSIDTLPFPYGLAASYSAPPAGLFHRTLLERLGDWLATQLDQGPRPALLVGHKLAIEGIAVAHAARRLGVPYALCVQGNTDQRIVRARPDLHSALGQVWRGASAIFPFAPWTLTAIERALGAPTVPPRLLPCATSLDTPIAPKVGGNGLVSAFHLRNWRTKNLDRTVAAVARAPERMRLNVIGGGDGPDAERCRAIGGRVPGVRFEGPLAHRAMPGRFNAATALVMPSRRESFGLVFVEALFAGLPIIYPAGQAIDGYFDGAEFALRVDANSTEAIGAAMVLAIEQEARLKADLAEWQSGPEIARFQRAAIARQFADGLTEALAPS